MHETWDSFKEFLRGFFKHFFMEVLPLLLFLAVDSLGGYFMNWPIPNYVPWLILALAIFIASFLTFNDLKTKANEAKEQLAKLILPKTSHVFFDPNDPNCIKDHEDENGQYILTSFRIGVKNIGITNIYKAKVSLVKCSRQDSVGNITPLGIRPDILEPVCTHDENGNLELVPNVPKYVTVLEYPMEPDKDQIYIAYMHQIEYETHSLPLNINLKYLIELVLSSENAAQIRYILRVTKGEGRQLAIQIEETMEESNINYAARNAIRNLELPDEYF